MSRKNLHSNLHPPHLHPRYEAEAGRGCPDHGRLHGASHVKKRHQKEKAHWVGSKTSYPVRFKPFRSFPHVGHGVGQPSDPHRDPHQKVQIRNKKHPKSKDFRCFMELLGGFEPPTSSLPIGLDPFCIVWCLPVAFASQGLRGFLFPIPWSFSVVLTPVDAKWTLRPAPGWPTKSFLSKFDIF